jgi:hypothetical protein
LKLTELDPHFLKRVSAVAYEHADDVRLAEGLQLQCPACYWASRRGGGAAHAVILWRDPARWHFIGHGYNDLSLMAGRLKVSMAGGACSCRFTIKDGKVDFH